jgi:putative acetyltransferase
VPSANVPLSAFLEHQSTDDLLEKAGIAVFAEGGQKEQIACTQNKSERMHVFDCKEEKSMMITTKIEIVPFRPAYLPAFVELNIQWIERYFRVEEHDIEQLQGAKEHILDAGGEIYSALLDNEVVGCVALIRESDTVFEIAKMAVRPDRQGLGIGELLGQHAIAEAKKMGCTYLYLVSNQSLVPALTLYHKLGFVEVPVGPTLYERANYKGEMHL